jgi:hypothetical protein
MRFGVPDANGARTMEAHLSQCLVMLGSEGLQD